MPSLPELFHGACLVGRIKVDGKLDIEHFAKSYGHITVSAEIKINLESVGEDHKQRGGRVQKSSLIKAEVYRQCQHVGKEYLFGKPDGEQGNPLCKIVRVKSAV